MNVLITGSGQLAKELMRATPDVAKTVMLDRNALDISRMDQCESVIAARQPDVVLNAAAYTAVDLAESERDAAFSVNEQGVANLAKACQSTGARLFHVSTDFVFDGNSGRPYSPGDATNPLSVYGESKLAGEAFLQREFSDAVIVRTGWLYSEYGKNFVSTMLKLFSEKPEISVIEDQIGTPTCAKGLAELLWRGIKKDVAGGIYHWSDAGVASWYDFAVAIQDEAFALGVLDAQTPIKPIAAHDYPTRATRPSFSVLNKRSTEEAFGTNTVHWRHQLKTMLRSLAEKNPVAGKVLK